MKELNFDFAIRDNKIRFYIELDGSPIFIIELTKEHYEKMIDKLKEARKEAWD